MRRDEGTKGRRDGGAPNWQSDDGTVALYWGDCLDVLPALADNSIDAVVTDPPYGLSFMGKAWDRSVPAVEVWRECLRVLKPGGHLLCFAGTRTHHRMATAIEDAGFEIRDMIAWVYGSGFPKSLDVSKAIDKAAGAEREKIQPGHAPAYQRNIGNHRPWMDDPDHKIEGQTPATPEAEQWDGWGTALKPALEPITLARKPLSGTVASNVLEHGTGALNVDGCRVGHAGGRTNHTRLQGKSGDWNGNRSTGQVTENGGRFPANLIHDGSDEVVALFPVTNSGAPHVLNDGGNRKMAFGMGESERLVGDGKGSAARFFYCAKASKADRDAGVAGVAGVAGSYKFRDGSLDGRDAPLRKNHHPTVKPTDLMRYLVRLVTPPGGTVLDPFCGSGSTGRGAVLEGMRFVGVEASVEYHDIAVKRIEAAFDEQSLFRRVEVANA